MRLIRFSMFRFDVSIRNRSNPTPLLSLQVLDSPYSSDMDYSRNIDIESKEFAWLCLNSSTDGVTWAVLEELQLQLTKST